VESGGASELPIRVSLEPPRESFFMWAAAQPRTGEAVPSVLGSVDGISCLLPVLACSCLPQSLIVD